MAATPIQLGPTAFTLTLTGVAQQLSDVLAAVLAAGQGLTMEPSIRSLVLQVDTAGGTYYFGTSAALSNTEYGFVLDSGSTSQGQLVIEAGPRELYLSQLWVLGNNGDVLRFFIIPCAG